jgi:hypothetical protein
MKDSTKNSFTNLSRRAFVSTGAAALFLRGNLAMATGQAQSDPLPSWNSGPAKDMVFSFVRDATDRSSTKYVEPADRIATFDQDGSYGPAVHLPDTSVGTFSEELLSKATKNAWVVISMKNDWKRIFSFEE